MTRGIMIAPLYCANGCFRKTLPSSMLKNLFIAFIVSVIPIFFLFVFVSSAVNRLSSLRRRCQSARVNRGGELADFAGMVAKLTEALRPSQPDEGELFEELVPACADAVVTGRSVAENRDEAAPLTELVRAETAFDEAAARLDALIRKKSELIAGTAWSELAREVATRRQRVVVARQVHQEAIAACDTAASQFPARWFTGKSRG